MSNSNKINWDNISKESQLSEEFIEKNFDKIDLYYLYRNKNIDKMVIFDL